MRAWPAPAQGLQAAGVSPGAFPLVDTSTTAYHNVLTLGNRQSLTWDGNDVTGLRNGVNAQTFAVYNTYTAGTPDYERLELMWSGNGAFLSVTKNGTGSFRAFSLNSGGATTFISDGSSLVTIGPSTKSSASTAATTIRTSYTATSGTGQTLAVSGTYSDGGTTSSTVIQTLSLAPTVNYTAASKTGKVVLAYFNPTLTSSPSGQNAALVFSSTLNGTTFPAMQFNNVADEDTNYEKCIMSWGAQVSNTFGIGVVKGGSGTLRNFSLFYAGSANAAVTVPSGVSGNLLIASSGTTSTTGVTRISLAGVGNATTTATSGTHTTCLVGETYGPSSTSTMFATSLLVNPTINYSNGTPGAGYVYGLYINPVNTALPTGISAAIALSSTASALGGIRILNTSDETTNYEHLTIKYISNVLTFTSTVGGTGTPRGISFVVTDPAAQQLVNHTATSTITGAVTDGYCASLQITPTYNAGSALTVTRHNYIDINQVTLTGSALCTDACIMRFNAAAGTHKAVDSGTTKTSPGTVTQWLKFNVNGVVAYVPSYSSKTT